MTLRSLSRVVKNLVDFESANVEAKARTRTTPNSRSLRRLVSCSTFNPIGSDSSELSHYSFQFLSMVLASLFFDYSLIAIGTTSSLHDTMSLKIQGLSPLVNRLFSTTFQSMRVRALLLCSFTHFAFVSRYLGTS